MTKKEDEMISRNLEFVGDAEALGLHKPLFNTFRIGMKWADLEPFDEVDLVVVDPETMERETLGGSAMAASVHHGSLGDMLALHSGLNHGCSQPMPTDRMIELRRILEDAYSRRLSDDEKCVVIYLARFL